MFPCHSPQLQCSEHVFILSYSFLPKKDGPRGFYRDERCRDQQNGRSNNKSDAGAHYIHHSFDPLKHAVMQNKKSWRIDKPALSYIVEENLARRLFSKSQHVIHNDTAHTAIQN